jgi:hypothetical protein
MDLHPSSDFELVHRWLRWGLNDCQVNRLTGIPRGTVRDWRHEGAPGLQARFSRVRIVLDARYTDIIDEATNAIALMRPSKRPRVGFVRKVGCMEVSAYWQHWPCMFPQHGVGRKQTRTIALVPWQARIAEAYARELLRGLIHSDGCRVTNRVWEGKYEFPRYFFTNRSEDVLEIFRRACDAVGIRYRNSKTDTISVARREDVAALDSFVGPKT